MVNIHARLSGGPLVLIGLPLLIVSIFIYHFSSEMGVGQPVALFLVFPIGLILTGMGAMRLVRKGMRNEGVGLDRNITGKQTWGWIVPTLLLVGVVAYSPLSRGWSIFLMLGVAFIASLLRKRFRQ
jgi:hypothetical protein